MPKISHALGRFVALVAGAATAVATVAAAADSTSAAAAPQTLLGFSADSSATELALERQFDAALNPRDQQAWLKQLASEPNQVGSPHDARNAKVIAEMLRSWGWDTRIETFYVLYPTPKKESLELVAPTTFQASLHEPPIPGDPLTTKAGALPPYNVYGADGDVTADLVYVNYGMADDYKDLARHGVDVRGKIVIARYGEGWRGLKPKLAYEHGAVGCIIYSDPYDDGYTPGDVYPQGAWRPREGVQRGSVADMTLYPGDPLTPGVGATKSAKRLAISEAKTVLKIPVIPISYADAQPLLAALAGPVAQPTWRGALPITYHLGPGPAKVHLAISSDWSLKPIYDVIATIKGSETPDQWVIRGNHHDGWVAGAFDPLAGAVAQFDEAKAIGTLVKGGWHPKRTLIYASWDAEEPGLLGSTEWAETHADELKSKAVLYLNTDTNGRGFLRMSGSHSLQRFMNQVAADIEDPETHVSVGARLRARLLVEGFSSAQARETAQAHEDDRKRAAIAASGADLPLDALGSGSDYSAFLQHLGVTALDFAYEGEAENSGVYHSLYDSYDHYVRFGDPGFAYGVAMSETGGHLMLRMAQAEVLPLQFTGLAATVENYRQEVHRLAEERRKHAEDLGRLLDEHAFTLASDPRHPLLPPRRDVQGPYLEFAPLDNAVARLQVAARSYDEAYAKMVASGAPLAADKRDELNDLLRGMEQTLTDSRGLPGRPWYVHMLYAPGSLTGYGAKTVPGIREAIEQDRWAEANEYVGITARALDAYSDRLERATALLPK